MLNDELKAVGETGEILIVGGSALALRGSERVTRDIDYFGKLPVSEAFLDKFGFDSSVASVMEIPDIHEIDADEFKAYSDLKVYVMSYEDLALAKLFTSRLKDEEDLLHYILPNIFDFARLRERMVNYEGYVAVPSRDMNYRSFDAYLGVLAESYRIYVYDPSVELGYILENLGVLERFKTSYHKSYTNTLKGDERAFLGHLEQLLSKPLGEIRHLNVLVLIKRWFGVDLRC